MFIYATANATGLYTDGFYFYGSQPPFGINALSFEASNVLVPAPFTFNDLLNHTGRYVVDIDTGLPYLRITHTTLQTFTGDGWGSLVLPNASYPNTLRMKIQELSHDSLLIDTAGLGNYFLIQPPDISQLTNYYWMRNGQPGLLLNISADSLGITGNRSSYLLAYTAGLPETVSQPAGPGVQVFPNPASEKVTVLLREPPSGKTVFSLYDLTGRTLRQQSMAGLQHYSFF